MSESMKDCGICNGYGEVPTGKIERDTGAVITVKCKHCDHGKVPLDDDMDLDAYIAEETAKAREDREIQKLMEEEALAAEVENAEQLADLEAQTADGEGEPS